MSSQVIGNITLDSSRFVYDMLFTFCAVFVRPFGITRAGVKRHHGYRVPISCAEANVESAPDRRKCASKRSNPYFTVYGNECSFFGP